MADLNYLFNPPKRNNYVMTEAEKEAAMPSKGGKLIMDNVKDGYPLSSHKVNAQGKIEVPLDDISAEVPVKADIPVTPKIGELKNIFSSQTVTTETPVAKSDLIDMDKVRSQVPRSETGLSDWLTVLAPLATEAIFGGGQAGGVSYGIAGNHALNKVKENNARSNKLEDKLMEIEKARSIASAKSQGKNALKTLEVDVDGNPIITRMEDAIGQKAWKDPKKAGMDRGEIAKLGREQAKLLADRALMTQARDKLVMNKQFQAAKARFQATNDAVDVLNQRNPVGDAGVQILFAKGIFGEVGNLTAQEQAKFIGSPELSQAFSRMYEKYKTGKLEETDRATLLKLATHMRNRSRIVAGEVAGGYTSGLKSMGIDPSGVIEPLLSGSEVAPQYQEQEVKRLGKDGKTYTYTLNPKTGKYE